MVIAKIDTPAQTAGNWNILQTGLGFVPENIANKVTSISAASTDVQYPSAKLLYDELQGLKTALSDIYTISNDTTDRAYDANNTTINELADILATVIKDMSLFNGIGGVPMKAVVDMTSAQILGSELSPVIILPTAPSGKINVPYYIFVEYKY